MNKNNKSRVLPDAATHRPPSQAQTPAPASPGQPAEEPVTERHYSLTLMEWTTTPGSAMKETILNDIDVSLGDLQVLTENSARAGDHIYKGQPTHEKLLKIGLKAMLDAFPPFELQNAVAANNALLQLLAEHIELAHMEDGPGSLRGIGSGPFLIGISQLLAMCRQRLNRATEVES